MFLQWEIQQKVRKFPVLDPLRKEMFIPVECFSVSPSLSSSFTKKIQTGIKGEHTRQSYMCPVLLCPNNTFRNTACMFHCEKHIATTIDLLMEKKNLATIKHKPPLKSTYQWTATSLLLIHQTIMNKTRLTAWKLIQHFMLLICHPHCFFKTLNIHVFVVVVRHSQHKTQLLHMH